MVREEEKCTEKGHMGQRGCSDKLSVLLLQHALQDRNAQSATLSEFHRDILMNH